MGNEEQWNDADFCSAKHTGGLYCGLYWIFTLLPAQAAIADDRQSSMSAELRYMAACSFKVLFVPGVMGSDQAQLITIAKLVWRDCCYSCMPMPPEPALAGTQRSRS